MDTKDILITDCSIHQGHYPHTKPFLRQAQISSRNCKPGRAYGKIIKVAGNKITLAMSLGKNSGTTRILVPKDSIPIFLDKDAIKTLQKRWQHKKGRQTKVVHF